MEHLFKDERGVHDRNNDILSWKRRRAETGRHYDEDGEEKPSRK